MELKARECPYCHHPIALKRCATYFLRGTAYHIHCNHCDSELALIKEPIPFQWSPFIGCMSTVLPATYCLFVLRLGFLQSMAYAVISGLIAIIIVAIITLKRSYFKIASD